MDREKSIVKKTIEVFHKLKLPFLDESIVTVPIGCPDVLSNANMVLRNVVLVNNTNCLTSVLQKEEINTLIDYFSEYVDIKGNMNELRSLPLFENVSGEYQLFSLALHMFGQIHAQMGINVG